MNATQSLSALVETAIGRHQTSVRQLSFLAQKQGFKVTHTTLNQVRSGTYKSVPSEVTIRAIAWLAGVDASVAFTAAGQPVPGPPFAEELPPGVDNLPPKARKAAIDMLRVLVDMNQDANAHSTKDVDTPTGVDKAGPDSRNTRTGQKTGKRHLHAIDHPENNIPLPENWQDLAAYSGPKSHLDRERDWSERGEESQDPGTSK